MIARNGEIILPKGNTRLQSWDQVTVLAHAPDSEKIRQTLTGTFEMPPGDYAKCDHLPKSEILP